jgi:monoamine oxidase
MPRHEVIIIGGGFTGLSAAVTLADAGRDIVLLEARHRVGGRVESKTLADGRRIDTGGQFLCEDMPEVMALAKAHGKTLVRSYVDGEATFQPPMSGETGDEIYGEVWALRGRLRAIDPDDPSVRGLTVSDWVARQTLRDEVRDGFLALVKGLWCRSPDEISFAYLVSNERRITNEVSELEFFLAESMHSLADDLAAKLGSRLRLNCPATRIVLSAEGVEVFAGEQSFSARRVIVAVPPVMARRLSFEPPLPQRLTQALSAWESGGVIKALVRYDRPFWRERDLSGMVLWRQPQGMFACDGSSGGHGMLVVFMGGPLAFEWHGRGVAAIERFIVESLTQTLGAEAGKPLDIALRDWVGDAWSGGAYSDAIVKPDALEAEQILLDGMPPIRFACSEISPSFPGYIEGAIIAGKDAARSILGEKQHVTG